MNYERFKELVSERLKDYLPASMSKFRMEILESNKVNVSLDAIHFVNSNTNVSPVIYINDMYDQYVVNHDLHKVLSNTAEKIEELFNDIPLISKGLNIENAKENIIFQLINTIQNKEMLDKIPNRTFHDLSIMYRWMIGGDNITRNIGVTEQELFSLAVENTQKLMQPCVKSMNDVMREILINDGISQDEVNTIINDISEENFLWVISNKQKTYGAASMLYEDMLHSLAKKMDSDLYIMPSSIHEVIAAPAMGNPYELAQVVAQINAHDVNLDERLSNQVYHYDKDLRKISLATSTEHQRIDNIDVLPPFRADLNR